MDMDKITYIVVIALPVFAMFAPSVYGAEELSVSFDTTPAGGFFSPQNCIVVWIEDDSGTFVRTIGRWAIVGQIYLLTWQISSGGTDTDGVSGATRGNHEDPLSATWDMRDKNGVIMPDGIYRVRLELADDLTIEDPEQNNLVTFTFDKNGTASVQNTSGGGFNNVIIDYSGRSAGSGSSKGPGCIPGQETFMITGTLMTCFVIISLAGMRRL